MLKRLSTPVEDEKANDDLLQMYLQQESEAAERRSELEKQLARLRSERQKHAARSSEAIAKLKSELHDLQNTTDQRLWQMSDEFARQDAQHIRAFHRKTGDIAALKAQLDKHSINQAATEKEEMDARSRSHRIAKRDLENAIKALDKDIAQKEAGKLRRAALRPFLPCCRKRNGVCFLLPELVLAGSGRTFLEI